jgi:hypothetical protein
MEKAIIRLDLAGDENGPSREQLAERPLPRSLVRNVINAALRQYEPEFGGTKVVHDGMSAMYAPAELPWRSKTCIDVNPDGVTSAPVPPAQRPGGGEASRLPARGPRTFAVKIKLAEVISTASLTDHYSNPDVSVTPLLQALSSALASRTPARLVHSSRRRGSAIGSPMFS